MSNLKKRLKKLAGVVQVTKVESCMTGGYSGIKVVLSGIKLEEVKSKETEIVNAVSKFIANDEIAKKTFFDNLYDPQAVFGDEELDVSAVTEEVLRDVFSNTFDPEMFEEDSDGKINFTYSTL